MHGYPVRISAEVSRNGKPEYFYVHKAVWKSQRDSGYFRKKVRMVIRVSSSIESRVSSLKNLINEHFTDRNRKLVDQSADAQLVIAEYIFLCIEDLAHFKGCMRLLVAYQEAWKYLLPDYCKQPRQRSLLRYLTYLQAYRRWSPDLHRFL